MKLLIESSIKNKFDYSTDGYILALKDYSVQSIITYTIDEIKDIVNNNSDKEFFISLNKNIFNDEIDGLKKMLIELDKLNIKGIFYYDLSILQLKMELGLKLNLVWNQTHMVNNYKTCDYYYSKGVKYALLGKEITLDEILEIVNTSKITSMVEVVSLPSVAYSKRKLISNYYKDLGKNGTNFLTIHEKVSNSDYEVVETKEGTSFFLKTITNGTKIIRDLYLNNTPYIVMREYGIDSDLFNNIVFDTHKYIDGKCLDDGYISKYAKLGDNSNFFFKKTIYRVKKNG